MYISSVSELSSSLSDVHGVNNLFDVFVSVKGLQDISGSLSSVDGVNGLVVNNEGDLSNLADSVSSGHNESRDGGSRDSGNQSVSLLGLVDLLVPSSPGLGGGEHSSSSAHVSESGLSSSVGSSSRNSGNTSHGSSSTPRFG